MTALVLPTAFFLFSLLTSATLLPGLSWVPLVDERLDRLSVEHKSWLERDVVYIITDRERDVFLTLESVDQVMAGLGFATYLKDDFASAADSLARALAPPDTMLLNTLGDSFEKLGKSDEARLAHYDSDPGAR